MKFDYIVTNYRHLVCMFWLLQMKLLWTFCTTFLFGNILLFHLDRYLKMEWLDNMVDVYLTINKLPNWSLKWCFIPSNSVVEFHFPQSCQHSVWSVSVILSILIGVMWYIMCFKFTFLYWLELSIFHVITYYAYVFFDVVPVQNFAHF